jgi:hypothetical protein
MLTGAACIAIAALAPAAMAATAPTGWQVVPSPNPTGSAALFGVSAASRANLWAVGVSIAADSSGRPLILHQSGTGAWKAVDVPALHVPGRLAGVSARGANDVWAVGTRLTPASVPLAAHFDGHAWKTVPTPPLLGSGAVFNGVSTLSPSNAWAVGSRTVPAGIATLVEHWDGHAWQLVPSPNADTFSELHAVVALSPTNVWAVGKKGDEFVLPLVEHWDGRAWTIVPVQIPRFHDELIGLTGISAVNANDIWAVGQGHLTEHWNGHIWQWVPAPAASTNPDDPTNFFGVSARSARDVWLVGAVAGTPGPKPVSEHWDGLKWTVVPINLGIGTQSAILNGVAAPPGGATVAVGYRLAQKNTSLILRRSR